LHLQKNRVIFDSYLTHKIFKPWQQKKLRKQQRKQLRRRKKQLQRKPRRNKFFAIVKKPDEIPASLFLVFTNGITFFIQEKKQEGVLQIANTLFDDCISSYFST